MPAAPASATPALVAGHARAALLTPDGELVTLDIADARARLHTLPPPLVVHLPATARRLGLAGFAAFDLLELFAFVRPARPCAPTPRGLALALDLTPAHGIEAEANLLPDIADDLLARLERLAGTPSGDEARALATLMRDAGWSWAPSALAVLGAARTAGTSLPGAAGTKPLTPADALAVWKRLPAWEETAPRPAPSSLAVPPAESRTRLAELLGADAEARPGQADYAHAVAVAFDPRAVRGDPILMLAEAGTGTGKTLGYIAPASLWAERNGGTVWISTYTRHLQRQIEREITTRFAERDGPDPNPDHRRRRVVVRKGRENYLCLLNLEDTVRLAGSRAPQGRMPATTIPLALVARWTMASSDGDLAGGDLPGWFRELFGAATIASLADRRGECIHGACAHYTRCFVEHSIRRARQADLVVANHALVMTQAAHGGGSGGSGGGATGFNKDRATGFDKDGATGSDRDGAINEDGATGVSEGGATGEDRIPTRYVFDEGHHLAEAADSAFAVTLSGVEAAELRRWLLGAEGARSRARGLKRRLDELVVGEPRLETPLEAALQAAAGGLPAPGWTTRLANTNPTSPNPTSPDPTSPDPALPDPTFGNPTETLLSRLHVQILARTADAGARGLGTPTNSECDIHPVPGPVIEAAAAAQRAYERIRVPLATLADRLAARLDEEADTIDAATRSRIEAMTGVIRRRAIDRLDAWIAMLRALREPAPPPGRRNEHVMFLRLDRLAREAAPRQDPSPLHDVALCRHWLDPTLPFAMTLATGAHGILVTSATLRDEGAPDLDPADGDADRAWRAAEARVGANHLPSPPRRASLASPFDYASQTRCFIVNDVAPNDPAAVAAAYRTLFLASGGGGLGLFTAISRLRAVHARIAPALEAAGIPLYAQHVDAMDNATLVDIFRTEPASCLLGTDAMRDGVDVPGAALRLVVFERVPWMRPDILHRERRLHLSEGNPGGYDDRIVRLRLRQAFGRLIRTATDRGVFVLLDRRMPSRLLTAFPKGVVAERTGLADAIERTASFLGGDQP